jgi:transposase
MASKKKTVTKKTTPLAPVNRRAAGVDIGSTFHVVAVPPDLDGDPVRSFRSFTADLNALADWLVGLR